jgi:hypothetical protein
MAKHDEYFIVWRKDEEVWAVEKPHAERASGLFDTQQDAVDQAKDWAPEGSIHLKGKNGKLRTIRE